MLGSLSVTSLPTQSVALAVQVKSSSHSRASPAQARRSSRLVLKKGKIKTTGINAGNGAILNFFLG